MHHPHRSFAKPGRHDTESRNDPPLEKPLAGEEKLPRMGFLRVREIITSQNSRQDLGQIGST